MTVTKPPTSDDPHHLLAEYYQVERVIRTYEDSVYKGVLRLLNRVQRNGRNGTA